MTDRRKDVSAALTEVRTLLSRAETAIRTVQQNGGQSEKRHIDPVMNDDGEYVPGYFEYFRDPDADEIVDLLTAFVKSVEKFGRNRKGI